MLSISFFAYSIEDINQLKDLEIIKTAIKR